MNNGTIRLPTSLPAKNIPPTARKTPPAGWTQVQAYLSSGTYSFQVPDNVYQIALHVNGGGALGGGGFAYGVLDVSPGQVVSGIVVGDVAGTSSVAGLLTATGATGSTGGSGQIISRLLRNTFTALGGTGTNGGGAGGSLYGNGGNGGTQGNAGDFPGGGGGNAPPNLESGAGAGATTSNKNGIRFLGGDSNPLFTGPIIATDGFLALVNKTLSGRGGGPFGNAIGAGGGGGTKSGLGALRGGNGGTLGGGGGGDGNNGSPAGDGGFLGGGGGGGGRGGNGGGGSGGGGQGAILIFWTPGY